jgi:large subunit ribosomal protein L15
MKLHDLRPAPGSHKARTRVGRGIAAGKGKTAGRGTKGQKARAGGSIPPWFEGGQTPLHMRIPKLRGFKNRFKVDYEVVNVGAIAAAAERGAFEGGEMPGTASKPKKAAPVTVNQELLRAVGLVRTLKKPLKILGNGELSTALFVVADAFTKSAVTKIEAAGGTTSVLEVPTEELTALGIGNEPRTAREPRTAAGRAAASRKVDARASRDAAVADRAQEASATAAAKEAKPPRAARSQASKAGAEPVETPDATEAGGATEAVVETAGTDPAPSADAATTEATEAPAQSEVESVTADSPGEPSREVESPDNGENA